MLDAVRPALVVTAALTALCCSACDSGRAFYPVQGKAFVDGAPAEGVTVVFHPLESFDPPLLPTGVVAADGSYTLQTWLVEERELKPGAPAGEYQVTCVWYPLDLAKYMGAETLPDKLNHKYEDKAKSGLTAKVAEGATEVPPLELTAKK